MDSTTHRKYPSESPGEVAEEGWNQSSLGMKHEGPLRKPSPCRGRHPRKDRAFECPPQIQNQRAGALNHTHQVPLPLLLGWTAPPGLFQAKLQQNWFHLMMVHSPHTQSQLGLQCIYAALLMSVSKRNLSL